MTKKKSVYAQWEKFLSSMGNAATTLGYNLLSNCMYAIYASNGTEIFRGNSTQYLRYLTKNNITDLRVVSVYPGGYALLPEGVRCLINKELTYDKRIKLNKALADGRFKNL